ncbi:MAG: response regulator [Desulfomonile sp.]|nr:response regulator [Desulfomonile sp.]
MPGPQIMVVEDEVVVAMELQSKLTSMGYVVAAATGSGEDAVEKAGELRPDLVLMDIQLAGDLDGIEAAQRIRQLYDIPVVFLTAHADEKTLQRAKLSEPFGYLIKPFSGAELRTTIEVSLYKHGRDVHEKEVTEWYSSALNVLGGAVVAATGDGVVKYVNNLAETLTGWKREDALGKHVREVLILMDCQSGTVKADPMQAFFRGPEPPAVECVLLSRGGSEIRVLLDVLPVTYSDGETHLVVFAFREAAQRAQPQQDWFSHAANLSIAGAICYEDGRYHESESFFTRALAILEENLGTDHHKLAGLLDQLCSVYVKLGKNNEASIVRTRAARIRAAREALGEGAAQGQARIKN